MLNTDITYERLNHSHHENGENMGKNYPSPFKNNNHNYSKLWILDLHTIQNIQNDLYVMPS